MIPYDLREGSDLTIREGVIAYDLREGVILTISGRE